MREIKLSQEAPLVSIVIPMYNAERFVGTTLNSLVGQRFKDIEIIVVNDGSTDNSKKVVDHFSFFRNLMYLEKENGGTGSALNLGHEHARGKYITWCSADNVYFPNFISTFVDTFRKIEEDKIPVEFVYSDFCYITEDNRRIKDVLHDAPQSGKDLIQGYDIGISFMYTKNLWEKTGGFWNRICEDFNWCVRAAKHTQFGLVKAVLAGFRIHGSQLTGSNKQEEMAAAEDCKRLAHQLFFDEESINRLSDELNRKLGIK